MGRGLFREGLPEDKGALLKVYGHAKERVGGAPAEDVNEKEKRTWAKAQVNGLRGTFRAAQEEYYKRELSMWMGQKAKQRKIDDAEESAEKEKLIAWAQETILDGSVDLRDVDNPLASVLLDSVVEFEQLEEGKRLQNQLLNGNGRDVSTLARTLDSAIQFYEQSLKDIEGGPELLAHVTGEVLGWMNIARDLMLSKASA